MVSYEAIWAKTKDTFLEARAVSGLKSTRNTRDTYERIVDQFLSYLTQTHGSQPHPTEIDPSLIADFVRLPIDRMRSKDRERRLESNKATMTPSDATRHLRLTVLTGLFDTAIFLKETETNPARNYRNIARIRLNSRKNNSEEMRNKGLNKKEKIRFFEVLSTLSSSAHINARNHLIFRLFEQSGLRLSGMVSLSVTDIDLQDMEISVVEKGNKRRTVIFMDDIRQLFEEYLSDHRPHLLRPDGDANALWPNNRGGRLGRNSLQKLCQKAIGLGGLNKPNFGPHLLRHTAITDMIDQGVAVQDVQLLAGHEDIGTTMGYYDVKARQARERARKVLDNS